MLAVPCGSARGQDTTFVDALAQRVSPLLPGDHWAVRAASRAEGMGLAPSFFPNQSAATLGEVGAALREAALNAEGGAAAPLAEGWLSRFNAEFRGEGGPVAGASRLGGSAGVLYNSVRGGLAPAVGTRQEGDTPLALPDADVLRAGFRASARLARGLAGRVDLAFDADRMEARQWEVVTGAA